MRRNPISGAVAPEPSRIFFTAIIVSFLSGFFPPPSGAQQFHRVGVAEKTEWALPKKKIVSLDEFFATIPEIEISPGGNKRSFYDSVITAVSTVAEGRVSATFKLPNPSGILIPSREETTLTIPVTDMGVPFVVGHKWTLFFDAKGEIARLQLPGTMTHYRKRTDQFVEVRVTDGNGQSFEVIPTTVMAPEAKIEGGFYSNIDLFRNAGMVAGTDNVGGPGSLELESISLLDIEVPRTNGLLADDTPWRSVSDGGMRGAIELHQLFAY